MIGKKFFSLLSIAMLLGSSVPVSAFTVTDPTSYTYYVQQIEQMVEQIQKQAEAVMELGNIKGLTTDVLGSVQGAYSYSQRLLGRLQDLQRDLKYKGSSLKYQAARWKTIALEPKYEDITDISVILDDIFQDPRQEGVTVYRDLDEIYNARQGALKDVIVDAEQTLDSWEENVQRVEDLAAQAEATEDLGQAQVLTNVILSEILLCLQQMRRFDAQYGQATSLLQFQGVSEEAYEFSKTDPGFSFDIPDEKSDSISDVVQFKEQRHITLE